MMTYTITERRTGLDGRPMFGTAPRSNPNAWPLTIPRLTDDQPQPRRKFEADIWMTNQVDEWRKGRP